MGNMDGGYKKLFSHPEMVSDLLRGFVKQDWVDELDFSTLEKIPASFVSDKLKERHDDVVWRIRWGSDFLYIYILLEFQSSVDKYMAVRMFSYLGLLYQDLIARKLLSRSGKLPPVLPLVLYNGKRHWRAATEISELIVPGPKGLQELQPKLKYLLIDEHRCSQDELKVAENLVSALFRLETSQSPEDMATIVKTLIEWLSHPEKTSLRRAFAIWIGRVLLPRKSEQGEDLYHETLEEVGGMLEETVKEWKETWKQQGIQEGIEEGIEQGRHKMILSAHKAGVPIGTIAKMADTSVEEIKGILFIDNNNET